MISRRTLLGAAGFAVFWPLAAGAQPGGTKPRVGFLHTFANEAQKAFNQALAESGYVNGQNVVVETRLWGQAAERLPQFAAELVALKCDVIFASSPYAILAAMNATSSIPVVGLDLESDPIERGWARSLGHPGGNFTGLFLNIPEMAGKQLQLLKDAVPKLTRVGLLWDPRIGGTQHHAFEAAARTAGITVVSLPVQRLGEVQEVLDRGAHEGAQGLVVLSSPFILAQRAEISRGALKNRLPSISLFTLFAESGALMVYGPDLIAMYRHAVTSYVDKILKGAKPADLPIEQPTRFQFIVNLKTASALGLTIPQSILLRADHVIQ